MHEVYHADEPGNIRVTSDYPAGDDEQLTPDKNASKRPPVWLIALLVATVFFFLFSLLLLGVALAWHFMSGSGA